MPAEMTLTAEDVNRTSGVYSDSIAGACWAYGYTVSRCIVGGHVADAYRMFGAVRRYFDRADDDARHELVRQYRDGRRAGRGWFKVTT